MSVNNRSATGQAALAYFDIVRIQQMIGQVGLLADLGEWDRFKTLYEKTVNVDYTSVFGGEPVVMDLDLLVGQWSEQLRWFDATQHQISNIEVEGSTGTARARAHVRATHVKQGRVWIVGGVYTMGLRYSDEWRITAQAIRVLYQDGDLALGDRTAAEWQV